MPLVALSTAVSPNLLAAFSIMVSAIYCHRESIQLAL